ncbi:semaphorin-2A-like [Lytechinus pictus]|uniref:semaphorin-2A-like n=1 Tax=Lytechinus pictus TaxID=7653 RepID=UPI0030BA1883
MFPTVSSNLTAGINWPAAGMSASSPDQKAMTLIKVKDGNMVIYSGAPTKAEYSYAFSRTIMSVDMPNSTPESVVRTNTDVSTWIETSSSMAPSFIGDPIEYNGKVYFFFREEAVEAKNVNKVVYSRVGQVCEVRSYPLLSPPPPSFPPPPISTLYRFFPLSLKIICSRIFW